MPRWLKTPVDGQQTDKRQTKFVQEFVEEEKNEKNLTPASNLIEFKRSLDVLISALDRIGIYFSTLNLFHRILFKYKLYKGYVSFNKQILSWKRNSELKIISIKLSSANTKKKFIDLFYFQITSAKHFFLSNTFKVDMTT